MRQARLYDIDELAVEARGWRHWLHQHPELGYELPLTSNFVARQLETIGCDGIETGIAGSGIVAVVNGNRPGRTIALRADMDALPIIEAGQCPHKSLHLGRMHACGHDGHTSMALGAVKHLAGDRDFPGRVAMIFQPAEEDGFGARAMIEAGIFDRFEIEEVYGLHNWPGLTAGHIAMREGPLMSAVDTIHGAFRGKGGHAARPQDCRDPLLAAAHFTMALQTLIGCERDARRPTVISITCLHAGETDNVISDRAEIAGTIRTLDREVRQTIVARVEEMAREIASFHQVTSDVQVRPEYPRTTNHPVQTRAAARAATDVVGVERVITDIEPSMLSEDFGAMLNVRPGAYVFLGSGEGPALHAPDYDFDDRLLPIGIRFLSTLARQSLARINA